MVEDIRPKIKATVIEQKIELKVMGIPPFIMIRTGCFPATAPIYSENQLNDAYRSTAGIDGVFVLRTSDGKLYNCMADIYEENDMINIFED